MKFNLKNVFLSVGIFAFVFALVGFVSTNKAEAAARTASVSGNWSDTATWGGSAVPTASDDVTVNTNINVVVDTAAVASSVIINSAGSNSGGISISGSNSLTVTGAVTLAAPSGDNASSELAVAAGTLSAGSLVITGGSAASRIVQVSVSTGTIDIAGDITLSGTASAARLTSTGASTINIGGSLSSGGTLTGTGSTITFDGTGSVLMGAYATYNNVVVNKVADPANKVTIDNGTTTIGGTLTVTSSILDVGTSVLTVSGATSIATAGQITFSSATGLKTFTGDVSVSGIWNETAVATAITFGGNLLNNASTWNGLSTGVHTFSGASKTISGTTETVMPSVTISGLTSNSGTLTVATALAGASTLTNASGAILNIGGTSSITGLTATATSNIVKYNKAGAQTVKVTSYFDLILDGSGAKAIGNGTDILKEIDIDSGVTASLTGSSTTKYLSFNGSRQKASSWGFTGAAGASNINTTYFSTNSGVEGDITASHGPSTSGGGPSSSTTTNTNTPETTTVPEVVAEIPTTPEIPVVTTTTPGLCPNGNTLASNCTTAPVISNSNTPTTTILKFTKYLTPKSAIVDVKNLQQALNEVGGASLIVDGKWGPKTTAVVKAFQKANGFSQVGVVGPQTRAKLNSLLGL